MNSNLSELQLDALREMGNIGAGHAAIALSQMLDKKIMISVTRSDIVPSEVYINNVTAGKDEIFTGVYLHTLGDVRGAIVYMFNKDSTLKLNGLLLPQQRKLSVFTDEHELSALKELGNILTGAFFSVFAEMFGLKIFHKTPCYVLDRAETIIHGVFEEVFGDQKGRLSIVTEFIESESQINGSFIFAPTEEAMSKIMAKLNIN